MIVFVQLAWREWVWVVRNRCLRYGETCGYSITLTAFLDTHPFTGLPRALDEERNLVLLRGLFGNRGDTSQLCLRSP